MLEEYIMLYMALSAVTLSDQPDEINWRWTSNGIYLTASAYKCQLKGSMVYFPAVDVWKAFCEPKCKFFTWLVLLNKILTVDSMAKKKLGMQSSLFFMLLFAGVRRSPLNEV
jgi:hypothetical protein